VRLISQGAKRYIPGTYRFGSNDGSNRILPLLTNSTPKHRHHTASGQSFVTLDGHDFCLGPGNAKPAGASRTVCPAAV
jgi:hypothetical protein